MTDLVSGDGDDASSPKLTDKQREMLFREQVRREEVDDHNPNLADTPSQLARAFHWGYSLHSKQQR